MRLWLFTFTQPDRKISSARIAAPTRVSACEIAENMIGRSLVAAANVNPEPGTILAVFGQVESDSARLISYVDASGDIFEVSR